jgi:hypothetical protein
MKPLIKKLLAIKKNKYRFHWYKAARTMLKNRRIKVTEAEIALG